MLASEATFKENLPSASVAVPIEVPFKVMFAPAIGEPFDLSDTVPDTSRVWAIASELAKKSNNSSSLHFIK